MLFKSVCLSLALQLSPTSSHRFLPVGTTCGSQFSSPESPLKIPNSAVSWANYAIFTCEDPIQWFQADADADQVLKFSVTVPAVERFEDTRMAAVFLGPGLPTLSDDDDIPESVLKYASDNGLGGVKYVSPDDQSTCAHITSDKLKNNVSTKDGRCHFWESGSSTNFWPVLDDVITAPEDGTYQVAVYEQNGFTAKASFACCDFPEDFITPYQVPEPECEVCGSQPTNPAWLSLWLEQKTMETYGGYPPIQSCVEDTSTIELPEEDECPPLPLAEDFAQQPEGCALGCGSNGECHSHNVFGECTHDLDWSIEPKFGDAPVNSLVIFKGDKIRFSHVIKDGTNPPDLNQLADESALNECSFDGATLLAEFEELTIGHVETFDKAGTFYFTARRGCDIQEGVIDGSACYCSLGQKLTVEVKDATDGLRCHNHEQEDPHLFDEDPAVTSPALRSGEGITKESASGLECAEGMVNARAIDNAGFGSSSENECSEFCSLPMAVQFMAGTELGSCFELGFISNPTEKTIRPEGSPQDILVTVTSKMTDKPESNCHCHSYEEIVCPEFESPEDTLYAEHIEEIEEYCTSILDGSESDCPYKCFQPMEVLHLHYIECPTRPIDPTYTKVDTTKRCHIAAAAPKGTTECPDVGEGADGRLVVIGAESVDKDEADASLDDGSGTVIKDNASPVFSLLPGVWIANMLLPFWFG